MRDFRRHENQFEATVCGEQSIVRDENRQVRVVKRDENVSPFDHSALLRQKFFFVFWEFELHRKWRENDFVLLLLSFFSLSKDYL